MRDEQWSPWVPHTYGRRSILRVALGGAATAASTALLAACGARSSLTASSAVATMSVARRTVTASAARPTVGGKLPSPAPNVPDAYLTPPPPFTSVTAVPGRGGKVSITKASQRPPAVPHDQNQSHAPTLLGREAKPCCPPLR